MSTLMFTILRFSIMLTLSHLILIATTNRNVLRRPNSHAYEERGGHTTSGPRL